MSPHPDPVPRSRQRMSFFRRRLAVGAFAILLGLAGCPSLIAASMTHGSAAMPPGGAGPVPPVPTIAMREAFARAEAAGIGRGAGREVHDEYDVARYDVNLSLDIPARVLTGVVTVDAVSRTAGLSALVLDLLAPMTVDAVTVNGAPAPWTHASALVTVTLDHAYAMDEPVTVTVWYHGTPSGSRLTWQTHAGVPVVTTQSEPDGAPFWWVCKDDPKDKALFTIHVTAPDTLFTVSNGVLVSVVQNGDGTATCNWTHQYPMSTYLFAIATSNHEGWSEIYTGLDGVSTMPVDYFVYPEDRSKAEVDWSHNLAMMAFYAGVFGEYPFLSEKYALVEVPGSGGMEDQTATFLGQDLLTGDNTWEFIVAHELAHSWVGDLITMRTWEHLWTKEGFATFSEALWFEHLYGAEYYHSYMDGFNYLPMMLARLYDVPENQGLAAYWKGAWVFHMLRHVIGEEPFFQGVRNYTGDPDLRYGCADTEDLREAFEASSGEDLAWFFDQWVYQPGIPKLVPVWDAVPAQGGWDVTLSLRQTQTLGPIFKMPIDVDVVTGSETERFVIWDSLQVQTFRFHVAARPIGLVLDPDHWLLWRLDATVEAPSAADAGRLPSIRVFPNPSGPGVFEEVRLVLPERGRTRLEVFDAAGRRVRCLFDGTAGPGTERVRWDGRNERGDLVPAGVYFHRLEQGGNASATRVVIVP